MSSYPFIDIAVLDAVRSAFAGGQGVFVLDAAARKVVWVNSGGAALLGSSVETIIGGPFERSIAARQIASAARSLPMGRRADLLVRLEARFGAPLVAVAVTPAPGPDGTRLLVVAGDARDLSEGERHVTILSTFSSGTAAALFGQRMAPLATTTAFDALGVDPVDLDRLREETEGASRVVKRPLKVKGGTLPSGIARLLDRPRLDLLVLVGSAEDVASDGPHLGGEASGALEAADVMEGEVPPLLGAPSDDAPSDSATSSSNTDAGDLETDDLEAGDTEASDTIETDDSAPFSQPDEPETGEQLSVGEPSSDSRSLSDTHETLSDAPSYDEPVSAPSVEVSDNARSDQPPVPSTINAPPPPGRPSFSDAPRVDEDTLDVSDELLPVRFTWETDGDGAFASLSPEFERAVGAHPGQYEGLMPDYVLDLLPADRRRLVAAFDRGERFSDRKVAWGVRAARLRVPVTFSGVPRYEDGAFMGFRGHGSVQLADAVFDESAALPFGDRDKNEPGKPNPVEGGEPNKGARNDGAPIGSSFEPPKSLTQDERRAFDEIGTTLRNRAESSTRSDPENVADEGTPSDREVSTDTARERERADVAAERADGAAETTPIDADRSAGRAEDPDPARSLSERSRSSDRGGSGRNGKKRNVLGAESNGANDKGAGTRDALDGELTSGGPRTGEEPTSGEEVNVRRRYDPAPPQSSEDDRAEHGLGNRQPAASSRLAPGRPRLKGRPRVRRSGRRIAEVAPQGSVTPERRSTDRPGRTTLPPQDIPKVAEERDATTAVREVATRDGSDGAARSGAAGVQAAGVRDREANAGDDSGVGKASDADTNGMDVGGVETSNVQTSDVGAHNATAEPSALASVLASARGTDNVQGRSGANRDDAAANESALDTAQADASSSGGANPGLNVDRGITNGRDDGPDQADGPDHDSERTQDGKPLLADNSAPNGGVDRFRAAVRPRAANGRPETPSRRPPPARVVGSGTTLPFRSRARARLFGETSPDNASHPPAGPNVSDGPSQTAAAPVSGSTSIELTSYPVNGQARGGSASSNDNAAVEPSLDRPRERPSEAYKRRLAAMMRRREAASGTQTPPRTTAKSEEPIDKAQQERLASGQRTNELADEGPAGEGAASERPLNGHRSAERASNSSSALDAAAPDTLRSKAAPATLAALDRVRAAAEGREASQGEAESEFDSGERTASHHEPSPNDGGPLDSGGAFRDATPIAAADGPAGNDGLAGDDGSVRGTAVEPQNPSGQDASDDHDERHDGEQHAERSEAEHGTRSEASAFGSVDAFNGADEIDGADGIGGVDVTEETAQENADRLSRTPPPVDTTLLGRLPVPVLVQNAKGLLYANPPFLKLTGYATLDELTRAGGMEALFDSTILPGSADASGEPMRLQRADGTRRPVSAQMQTVPWTSDDGESEGAFLLTVRAADDRGRPLPDMPDEVMPGAIEDRLVSLNAVLDEATDGVVFLDAERNIRSLSRSAASLLGYSGEEIRGRSFAVLFAPESQRAAIDLIGSMGGKGPRRRSGIELTGLTVADDEVPLFVTVGALRDEGGFCAVLRDVSDWRRAENELRAARDEAEAASREKSRFLTRVSHEIRTPLNAIIGFAEVMSEERLGPVSNQRYREYLADIRSSGRHVLDLVNDLLDIAKIESGRDDLRFEAVDVNSELEDAVSVLQLQATEGRVIVRTALNPMPPVVADKRSVKQIALNILSNAIRYTEPGGQVIVSTKLTDEGVTARIRDTGVGMSQDDIDRALEPFAQAPSRSESMARRSRAGTGLGLPLSKAMAEANRAHFTLSSVRGRGTLVELRFPKDRILD